jgi:hypothetical protein
MTLLDEVLRNYLSSHKEMLATEQVDENNVIVSFPLHFVGNHRVEVSVTRAMGGFLLISDMGRTISSLRDYGYAISEKLQSRMLQIIKPANVRIVDENLIADCRPEDIGVSLHSFVEAAKTIGDAYLAFHVKTPPEKKLLEAIGALLSEMEIAYRADHKIHGKIDTHSVNFYVPPNGHPGLALEVLGGFNTHATAQIWYFKCEDIRAFDSRLKVGIVYDIEDSTWSNKSQAILHNVADFALPSSDLPALPDFVKSTVS